MTDEPTFKLGIEEEYLIVDPENMDLVKCPDPALIKKCREQVGDKVTNEYLQCQLEVGTSPHNSVKESAEDLANLRSIVSQTCQEFGYAPIAASTHPIATWRRQSRTPKERYEALGTDMGQAADRMLICGMHIHVEVSDKELRIDLLNQVSYFLPHLLALSCSSPYWEGEDTLLASYRLAVFDAMPRTGIPDYLASYQEYKQLIGYLVNSGCIGDATKLWWDVRPSAKFPTLEQRITDICSTKSEAIAIVATFQSIVKFLHGLRSQNQRWRNYPATLIHENRWRAQRYGCENKLLDLGKASLVPFPQLLEELIQLISEDAKKLGCYDEMIRIRDIVERGNSAQRQRGAYKFARKGGASHDEALRVVVQHLIDEFLQD